MEDKKLTKPFGLLQESFLYFGNCEFPDYLFLIKSYLEKNKHEK